MAKAIKHKRKEEIFPLEKSNFMIIGVGILVIIAGYVALMEMTVEGFLPLTLAPILLVLGYCVIVPIGIVYTKRSKPSAN